MRSVCSREMRERPTAIVFPVHFVEYGRNGNPVLVKSVIQHGITLVISTTW